MPHALTRSALALATLGLVLSACAVGPDYRRPELKLTGAYLGAPAAAAEANPAPDRWWTLFGDPGLDRAVDRALAQNLDLDQARARLTQSRALARAAGAALAPSGAAQAQAADEKQALLSPIGEIGRHLPGYRREVDVYDLGAGASWEPDLFGGLRRARDAARAEALGAQDQAAAVRLAVAADAADAYLQVRAYQARLAVARRQAAVEQDLVDLLTRRGKEGVIAERDLHEARAALEGVLAGIPPLTAGLEAEMNRLDVLMGAQPGTYRADLVQAEPLPAAPQVTAAEGPAGLLRRRPDVLAAEQRLVAANARIGAAIADYYPKISLAGLAGVESIDSSQIFTGDALQHQLSAGLRWRLFDFGRVDAEVAQARGREAEALAGYRATVLRAAEEVEDAFADLTQSQARAAALRRQIEQLTLARRQAQQAYEGGVISLIEVRDADRELLSASDQLAQAEAGADRAAVAAYRALGGGWG